MSAPIKPLGGKAYGSIGHLPQSRLGPGDWSIHEGQARICLEKPRNGDRVICTEKIDGSCMAVANIDGAIVPLTRSGYRAGAGTYEHLRVFEKYVSNNWSVFMEVLRPGERIVGEWTAMAAGTRYDRLHPRFSPFIAFDIFRGKDRVLRDEFERVTWAAGMETASILYDGPLGFSIEQALAELGPNGKHGAIDPVEGAVWRVEREGRVDFLAKFVRHDKQDGVFFPNLSGRPAVWNCPEYSEAA